MAQQSSGSGPIRALMFMAVAVVLGSVALVVLYGLITTYQQRIDEARRPEDTVMVIVAARDLYQGVTVTEEDLYAVEIPPRFLPEGVFLSPEHVVGRIPRERILANEFVRADRLSDPESGVGLNAIIPRGMRAISVDIQDGQALSGFLNPADYVDVLVTIDEEGKQAPETKILLQAVFVLGVNSRMGSESREEATSKRRRTAPSVTLLVNTEQAEQLAHNEKMGRLQLALRNAQDVNIVDSDGVNLDALRTKLEVAKPVRVRVKTVEPKEQLQQLKIIRGDKVTTETVGEDGTIKK